MKETIVRAVVPRLNMGAPGPPARPRASASVCLSLVEVARRARLFLYLHALRVGSAQSATSRTSTTSPARHQNVPRTSSQNAKFRHNLVVVAILRNICISTLETVVV
jgi:hypothetical protein